MILKFNQDELDILNELCYIQIESYGIILEQKLLKQDINLLLAFNSSLEEAEREAKWRITQYKEIIKNPLYLGILENSEVLTLRHLLFHSEEEYISNGLSHAIKGLWQKFFTIEEERNPIVTLTKNKVKKMKKFGVKDWKHIEKVDTSSRSSRILEVAWRNSPSESGILSITFKGNKKYEYMGITEELANQLISAESLGKFFDEHINKKYTFRKQGELQFHE